MNFDPMKPIWAQVAAQLKQQVASGKLPPGSKLPGGRELAVQYGINPNTAARIYQELEREGVCETRRGLGTFVADSPGLVRKLKKDMAGASVTRFLAEMEGLGLTREDVIELIQGGEER